MIRRREFIAGLGGAAAWPVVARAQQPAVPVIGFLDFGAPETTNMAAFRSGLSDTGFSEGRNLRSNIASLTATVTGFRNWLLT